MAERILVIEDDEAVAALLGSVLRRGGFDVTRCGDGRSGLKRMHEAAPDLVILDVVLPDLDGWTLVGLLHDISDVPVLMLTGRTMRTDIVRGLQAGADDYLTKPFDTGELLARLEALLRRRRHSAPVSQDLVVEGPLQIDFVARTVVLDGREIAVTPIEFRLLAALVRHRGQILSPDQLLELAWSDPSGTSPERVKFSIHRLRRKLGWDAQGSPVEAIRGFGYRYRSPDGQ